MEAGGAKITLLAAYHGLYPDPARIEDVTSVLRVPGTKHLKDRTNPLDVRVLSGTRRPPLSPSLRGSWTGRCSWCPRKRPPGAGKREAF